jgi:hypothetical protein
MVLEQNLGLLSPGLVNVDLTVVLLDDAVLLNLVHLLCVQDVVGSHLSAVLADHGVDGVVAGRREQVAVEVLLANHSHETIVSIFVTLLGSILL